MFGIHWFDFAILILYFAVILYIGVILGGRKTKTLGDFFVAGGKWGAVVSFIFVFASAVAGNEAVAVSGQAYVSGLSGVWYWWSFLFATPIYFAFSTYFKRARVYNVSEFFEMRYDKYAASLYSVVAGIISILFIGIVLLAIAKVLAGLTQVSRQQCVWFICVIVGAYVFSGGMMSALLTDLLQGVMCLFVLSFIMLPFLWVKAGGWAALQQYSSSHPQIWNLMDAEHMTVWTVLALNVAAIVGGTAAPWIYNWIAISKDEKAATQCGWSHIWKRIVTLMFAVYGILFAIYLPGLEDPEMAWGVAMREILPVGTKGLLIASFFAAAMSSVDTFATTSSALVADFLYRRMIRPGKALKHYLLVGRFWGLFAILIAAVSTYYIGSVKEYVKLVLTLLSFLGIPLYFGVVWRRANRTGMWMSLVGGMATYLVVVAVVMAREQADFFAAIKPAFVPAVFLSTAVSLAGMIAGCLFGRADCTNKLNRFYVIMNTPIGKEKRLVDAGIRLPAMIDAGLVEAGEEELNIEVLKNLYEQDCEYKIFGPDSSIELRKEPGLEWYYPGLLKVTVACFALVFITWLVTKILFVW